MHRAYGLLPNMTFVLDRGGTILYKAMWTSAVRIREFLERRPLTATGFTHTTFHTEQLELRERDAAAFQAGLARNGPRAVAEFARAEAIWAARARRP